MEYKVLNEETKELIRESFKENSQDWTLEETKVAVHNYRNELIKLEKDIKLKTIAIDSYKKDSSILAPVFAYEQSKEYADTLRDMKIPDMEAELQKVIGKIESTTFQIPLMEEKVIVLQAMEK